MWSVLKKSIFAYLKFNICIVYLNFEICIPSQFSDVLWFFECSVVQLSPISLLTFHMYDLITWHSSALHLYICLVRPPPQAYQSLFPYLTFHIPSFSWIGNNYLIWTWDGIGFTVVTNVRHLEHPEIPYLNTSTLEVS